MSEKTFRTLWALQGIVLGLLIGFAIGWANGKHAADRWWQAHQMTVTHLDLDNHRGHILRLCPDAIHCTDYSVLPRCPEWDTSCGFKPGDWTGGGNPYVDADNTICYDPTTGKRCDLQNESKQIDEKIRDIEKEIEKRNEWEALQGTAVVVLGDCSNVDEETWNKRHCTQRKAKLLEGAKKFQ